jgi:glycosyltransferase involved in cell wall biosynthesis
MLQKLHKLRRGPDLSRQRRVPNRGVSLSIVITAHNEAGQLRRTVESLRENTTLANEFVVVDDASTDGCCDAIDADRVYVIRHLSRLGVAPSRLEASRRVTGDCLAFCDGHQRVSPGCIDRCAELALRRNCIVSPALQGFGATDPLLYGASFRMCPDKGFFSATWVLHRSFRRARPFSALRAPSYVIPRAIFDRVCWIRGMGGWGGSEAAVSVKAFFSGVTILGLRGPVAWHRFKPSFHYDVTWDEIWRNHALIARVCFEDRTWYEYWLPQVFQEHLTPQAQRDLESNEIVAQHEEFCRRKVRADSDFWRILLRQEPPAAVRE